jgi:uncharacterized protein (DUF1697 family)
LPRYVALLRAINVGGHVIRMDALRAHFEHLGFTDVSTFIASGNVLFTSRTGTPAAMERRIAHALQDALGYPVETFLRTPPEMTAAAGHAPFDDLADGDALSVGFLARALTPAERRAVQGFAGATDDFGINARELYWRSRVRISESRFSLARFEKALGVPATFRNVTTVRKIAALLTEVSGAG